MIKVVSVSRQFGAGGHAFAQALAKELNVPLYDRQLIHVAAAQLLADGKLTVEKLMEIEAEVPPLGMSFLSFFNFGIRGEKPLNDRMFEAESTVVNKLYEQGPCVILGRCSDFILGKRSDVLTVFVHGSDEYRKQYALDHYTGKPLSVLKDEDKKRAAYYNYYNAQQFGDPANYDLMLHADAGTPESLARGIAAMVKAM